ncbi:MAG: hypothetical protein CMJ64_19590 [Planctomycetaceae bacterium]|jgi:hypothetical protein|nr:hypothetical protein [Planctomycetaceae bacterium]
MPKTYIAETLSQTVAPSVSSDSQESGMKIVSDIMPKRFNDTTKPTPNPIAGEALSSTTFPTNNGGTLE